MPTKYLLPMTNSISTLTLGLWLNMECMGPWGQKNVFRGETHSHKWGRVQGMKPNDFHFGNYIGARVVNVQNLGWKGKQVSN